MNNLISSVSTSLTRLFSTPLSYGHELYAPEFFTQKLEGQAKTLGNPTKIPENITKVLANSAITSTTPAPSLPQTNETRIRQLIAKINECPATKKLLDQANSAKNSKGVHSKSWNIELVKKNGPTKDNKDLTEFEDGKGFKFTLPTRSGACCNHNKRTIYISDEYSDRETLGLAIFELTNALQSEKHLLVHNKAVKGEITCEEYVEQSETIEFEGNFIAYEAIQEGIKNHKWANLTSNAFHENMPVHMKDKSEIKNYIEKVYKFTAHADYYRKGWEVITGKSSDVLKEKKYIPSIETEIKEFSHTPFDKFLLKFQKEIDIILKQNSNFSQSLVQTARMIFTTFDAQSQMVGFNKASQFIRNPSGFLDNEVRVGLEELKAKYGQFPILQGELFDKIEELQRNSKVAVDKLIQRIKEIFEIEGVNFNIQTLIEMIGKDTELVDFCNTYIKDCEKYVKDLTEQNNARFEAFKEVIKKGVKWCHSQKVRDEIEATGFKFKPMMIKRDRCICTYCKVEVSGWRPWMDPKEFHDHSISHSTPGK